MLIGFASAVPFADGRTDGEILREVACDRIYSAEHGVLAFRQLMSYVRAGDTAVVTDLARLGSDIDAVISMANELHVASVALHVVGSEIVPGTPVGDGFPQVCAILLRYRSSVDRQNGRDAKFKARGRPPALTAETKTQLERLLRGGQLNVSAIAKVFDISPATIYRHFPAAASRGRSGTASRQNRGKRPPSPSPSAATHRATTDHSVEAFVIDATITRFAEQLVIENDTGSRTQIKKLLLEEENKLGRRSEALADVLRRMDECRERIARLEQLRERSRAIGYDTATTDRVLRNLHELYALYSDYHRTIVEAENRSPI